MRVKKQPLPALVPMLVARWASEYIQRLRPREHAGLVFGIEPGAESRVRIARPVPGGPGVTVVWMDLEPTQAACGPALDIAVRFLLDRARVPNGTQTQVQPDFRSIWAYAVQIAVAQQTAISFKINRDHAEPSREMRVHLVDGKRQCNFVIEQLNRLGFVYAEARLQRAKIPFDKVEQFAAGYDFAMLVDAKPQITNAEITAADAAFEGM